MIVTFSLISFIGMILLPLAIGFVIIKRFNISFRDFRKLFIAGALTFIVAQILHIPVVYGLTVLLNKTTPANLNEHATLIVNAVVLGLLAGMFEEPARYILFKWVRKEKDTTQNALIIGLGHGGIEAILIGIASLATVAQMIALREVADFSALGIPAEQIEIVKSQVQVFWSQPAAMPLFGLAERIAAISLHIGLSIMVFYGVSTHQRKWLWIAILWHAFIDAVAVYFAPKLAASGHIVLSTLALESFLLLVGVGTLIYARGLQIKHPIEKEADSI